MYAKERYNRRNAAASQSTLHTNELCCKPTSMKRGAAPAGSPAQLTCVRRSLPRGA